MPSSTNGHRMNQLVAPTSFITSISRLRANIAVRIVFQMSVTETAPRMTAPATVTTLKKLDSVRTKATTSRAEVTRYTPGCPPSCCVRRLSEASSADTGLMRKLVGTCSIVSRAWISGESGYRRLTSAIAAGLSTKLTPPFLTRGEPCRNFIVASV